MHTETYVADIYSKLLDVGTIWHYKNSIIISSSLSDAKIQ